MATCDITQLLADGRCFMCLNKQQADAVMAQMLCDLVAAVTPAAACHDLFQDSFEVGPQGAELLDPPWQHPGDTFLYNLGTAIEDPGGDGSRAHVSASSMINGYVQAECLGTGVHTVVLRFDPDFANVFYGATINETTDQIQLVKGSTVLATVSATFVAGQVLRLEAAGATLTVKYNGATVLVMTDTSSPILTAGLAGMHGSNGLGAVFDDFECCSTD